MILYYRLMTKWSGLDDITKLSQVGLSHTLQVGVECCSDLGESVEAWVLGACQRYHRLLSATGTTRDVAVVTEAQLLTFLERRENRALLAALLADAR
jgi:hypothetical protein